MKLKKLNKSQRYKLAIKLINELIINYRERLHYWRKLTNQSAQIDTGYVAQHLVSLVTKIPGEDMRGKGYDLIDKSEIKSANFLDSLDKRGGAAPRWNFTSNDLNGMQSYLKVPAIYLVSIDFNPAEKIRLRIWKLDPGKHPVLSKRYRLWMKKLGKPKLKDPKRPAVNFQLFPPKNKTNDGYARHGSGKKNGFPPIKIPLEKITGSKLIFKAEENNKGKLCLNNKNLTNI